MLHGDYLHDDGFRGTGMLIAVLDAGFQGADTIIALDSIRTTNRIIATRDFVDGDTLVYDHHNHGTHVLSCMAANLPGTMIGTAPDASFILLRTEDTGSEYLIEEYEWSCGAEFADSVGTDVINSSLGYTTFDSPLYNHTYADMNGDSAIATQAADIAASKGILVVVSAGNSGGGPWNFIGSPADGDSVLAVGGVDSSGVSVSFSSRGPSSDGRVKPNVCAQAFQSFIAYNNGSFGPGSGTSFAAPITAGMAACLWQSCSSYSNMQILHAIEISADHYFTPDTLYGYGIPDFSLACLILNGNTHVRDDLIISLYPNPFTDNCIINFYSSIRQNIHAEVFDIIGKKILEQDIRLPAIEKYQFVIPADALPQKGAYILRIITAEKTLVRKIIRE
jgi:subtilisin family serine protease